MRLRHLACGHLIGEPTTPSVQPGDLPIGSGTGETEGCLVAARQARSLGGTVALLTAAPESAIGEFADLCILLRSQSRSQQSPGSPMLLGTIFEQALLVFCDGLRTAGGESGGS
jgi:6-phospho-3-hexuloisomerase